MSDPTCMRCEKPMRADQAYACGSCSSHLRALLARTAKLAGEARITIAKLDEMPAGPGKPDDLGWWKTGNALEAIELPYRPEASEAYQAALGELITWARHCCEERGIDYAESGGLDGLCGFLSGQVEWLRHRPEADEAFGVVERACKQIERIVDRRPEGEFIGMCGCGTALYHRGGDTAMCPRCGTEYDPAISRASYETALEADSVSATEAADRVAIMGLVTDTAKLRKLIWAWADRGHLHLVCDHSSCMAARIGELAGPACRPADIRYRFGDVLARVMASPALRVA